MKQKDYFTLLENLAKQSNYLNHSANEQHFEKLLQSGDPFAMFVLEDFLNARKSTLHTPFMLAQSYDWDYADNRHDSRFKQYNGAFILLDFYGKGDFQKRVDIIDKTEEEAEKLVEQMRKDYANNPQLGRFQLDNTNGSPIVVEKLGYAGTRIDFSFLRPYNATLKAQVQ